MKPTNLTLFVISLILITSCTTVGEKKSEIPYTWKNVTISGGGFVPGIIFHPEESGLRYCRTDMGGAYRWDQEKSRWIPLLDWLSYDDRNLMGVESIALDPSDPDRLYIACGTYTNQTAPNGAILVSDDRGRNFRRTDVPFKMGGNENGRGNGERMAVDPLDGKIIYLGTRHAGLWRSLDQGENWEQVRDFPDISEPLPDENTDRRTRWSMMQNRGSGVVFVLFGIQSRSENRSSEIFAGVSLMGRENLFRSTDEGENWEAVPGQPTDFMITHGVINKKGELIISYGTNPGPWPMTNGAVWKYNTVSGEWTDITPDHPDPENDRAFGYAAVSVDASDPDVIIASSFHRYSKKAGGEEIFLTTDGGMNWTPVMKNSEFEYSRAPYVQHTEVHWMFDIEIDPFDPGHAMFTTGYGGHETYNLRDAENGGKVIWQIMSTGIEETVPLELLSPPSGAQLITAVGDYCGFAHYDLDNPVPEGCFVNPHFANTNGIACAELKPEIMVRVGINAEREGMMNIGYSMDGGKTWNPLATMPADDTRLGHIAVSADGSSWVWTPQNSRAFQTSDMGETWNEIMELPRDTRVIADRVDPSVFYAIDLFNGKFYTSNDGGISFSVINFNLPDGLPVDMRGRGDTRGGQDRIYATPGMKGDTWLAAFDGLYHFENSVADITKYPAVEEIHAFGFGKPAPRKDVPAIYLVGTINGVRGIFRSDDFAENWIRINDDQHQWGLILHITGDPKKYGRVYVGTHGRGAIYGDPA